MTTQSQGLVVREMVHDLLGESNGESKYDLDTIEGYFLSALDMILADSGMSRVEGYVWRGMTSSLELFKTMHRPTGRELFSRVRIFFGEENYEERWALPNNAVDNKFYLDRLQVMKDYIVRCMGAEEIGESTEQDGSDSSELGESMAMVSLFGADRPRTDAISIMMKQGPKKVPTGATKKAKKVSTGAAKKVREDVLGAKVEDEELDETPKAKEKFDASDKGKKVVSNGFRASFPKGKTYTLTGNRRWVMAGTGYEYEMKGSGGKKIWLDGHGFDLKEDVELDEADLFRQTTLRDIKKGAQLMYTGKTKVKKVKVVRFDKSDFKRGVVVVSPVGGGKELEVDMKRLRAPRADEDVESEGNEMENGIRVLRDDLLECGCEEPDEDVEVDEEMSSAGYPGVTPLAGKETPPESGGAKKFGNVARQIRSDLLGDPSQVDDAGGDEDYPGTMPGKKGYGTKKQSGSARKFGNAPAKGLRQKAKVTPGVVPGSSEYPGTSSMGEDTEPGENDVHDLWSELLGEALPKAGSKVDAPGSPFHGAEYISVHSRKDALRSGDLHDVTKYAKENGFKFPTAVTRSLWSVINKISRGSGQDVAGRMADIFNMMRFFMRHASGDTLRLKVKIGRKTHLLMSKVGPGDDPRPVMTIGYPDDF